MTSIIQFIGREKKAKEVFYIKQIEKSEAYEFIKQYHYLGDAKFFSKFAYALIDRENEQVMGVATFSNPQGNVALKGWFGLPNTDQTVLELSRLCILPTLNNTNATSYLLGNSIKLLKKEGVRAVITLADSSRHVGSVYQVCNFKYYGLTDKKSDFYRWDGKVNPRGVTKDVEGVWVPRTRKHRYAYIIDKSLVCNYSESERPKKEEQTGYECCGGNKFVEDKRFGKKYTCPVCSNEEFMEVYF